MFLKLLIKGKQQPLAFDIFFSTLLKFSLQINCSGKESKSLALVFTEFFVLGSNDFRVDFVVKVDNITKTSKRRGK